MKILLLTLQIFILGLFIYIICNILYDNYNYMYIIYNNDNPFDIFSNLNFENTLILLKNNNLLRESVKNSSKNCNFFSKFKLEKIKSFINTKRETEAPKWKLRINVLKFIFLCKRNNW